MKARNDSLFGTADFMSIPMNHMGHEAVDVHANNRPLQEAWMAENSGKKLWRLEPTLYRLLPEILKERYLTLGTRGRRFEEILARQIEAFQPSVLYNHDPSNISTDLLKAIMPKGCALVGQIASPRNSAINWCDYDLMISSLPNFVREFKKEGVTAEYLPLAFEVGILAHLSPGPRNIPLSFVGSVSTLHSERLKFLERIAEFDDLAIWGDGVLGLFNRSRIRLRYRGSAWGREMYAILHHSKLTLNKHIDVAADYANNMRLYEATGVGTCLLTDWKENLDNLFEVGREVVAYRSEAECTDLIRFYLTHDRERVKIARAGHERCLRDHNYQRRMAELEAILARHL
jgi:hypothetical protein